MLGLLKTASNVNVSINFFGRSRTLLTKHMRFKIQTLLGLEITVLNYACVWNYDYFILQLTI